ncbi:hypothetical protein [Bosea vestrisii]|uniref:Uncharacterized protein n=1 Tax=Bosea vestrisii TaxID=151416 RepID=A0ABW0H2J1_9HYPH
MQNEVSSAEPVADSTEVGSAIIEILRERGAVDRPLRLAALGQRLSAQFGQPLRNIIGDRKLSDFIRFSVGRMVSFEGEGGSLAVRLEKDAGLQERPLRFDPTFWAAFSKPVRSGCYRALHIHRPFRFSDNEEAPTNSEELHSIDSDLIPPADLNKPERDAAIRKSIDTWCKNNGLIPSNFLVKPRADTSYGNHARARSSEEEARFTNHPGASALISLARAVPESERSKHSLTLDLIYTLLNR